MAITCSKNPGNLTRSASPSSASATAPLRSCRASSITRTPLSANSFPASCTSLGGYHVRDIEFSAAFDIDANKVGKDLSRSDLLRTEQYDQVCGCPAAWRAGSPRHDARRPRQVPLRGHHQGRRPDRRYRPASCGDGDRRRRLLPPGRLRDGDEVVRRADPGSGLRFRELHSGLHRPKSEYWQKRFIDRGVPIIGDDIKSQVGATITHRVLARLFADRGVRIDRTYQLNFGGNTDFLNMLERERLDSKKVSKTNAVTSQIDYLLPGTDVHVGPSDYVPWLEDRKWCHIRIEGTTFGDVPLNMELKLEVWDSPNSAGVVIDAVRCAKLALEQQHQRRALCAPSSYFMKSPAGAIPRRHRARPGRRVHRDLETTATRVASGSRRFDQRDLTEPWRPPTVGRSGRSARGRARMLLRGPVCFQRFQWTMSVQPISGASLRENWYNYVAKFTL